MSNRVQDALESFMNLMRWFGLMVLSLATLAGILLVLFDVAHYLFYSSDFTVQEITSNPTEWVDQEEILSRVAIAPGTNIWMVSREKIRRRLESHPMIRRADVQRIPPKRIHIWIEERRPIAYALNPADSYLYGLDKEGVILPPITSRDFENPDNNYQAKLIKRVQSFPLVGGALNLAFVPGQAENNDNLKVCLQLMNQLRTDCPEFYPEIAEAEWKEEGNWVLHPRRRIGVVVLRNLNARDLGKKINALWNLLEEKNLRAIYVDARFPDKGFAVRFDGSDGGRWKELYRNSETIVSQTLQAES